MKQCLSYLSFCPLGILYNSKLILMATSLGTIAVVVTRVHCICMRTSSCFYLNYGFSASFNGEAEIRFYYSNEVLQNKNIKNFIYFGLLMILSIFSDTDV